MARISFPQPAARGFEIQNSPHLRVAATWQTLTNLPIFQTKRTAIVSDPTDAGTNRLFRVRVFES